MPFTDPIKSPAFYFLSPIDTTGERQPSEGDLKRRSHVYPMTSPGIPVLVSALPFVKSLPRESPLCLYDPMNIFRREAWPYRKHKIAIFLLVDVFLFDIIASITAKGLSKAMEFPSGSINTFIPLLKSFDQVPCQADMHILSGSLRRKQPGLQQRNALRGAGSRH